MLLLHLALQAERRVPPVATNARGNVCEVKNNPVCTLFVPGVKRGAQHVEKCGLFCKCGLPKQWRHRWHTTRRRPPARLGATLATPDLQKLWSTAATAWGSDFGKSGSDLTPDTCWGLWGTQDGRMAEVRFWGNSSALASRGQAQAGMAGWRTVGRKKLIRIHILKIIARRSISWNICWGERKE